MEFKHKSVLFQESIDALGLKDGMIAADGTAGGGGHSRAIAQRIGSGRLYAIDRDPDAVQVLRERLGDLPNVTVVHDRFSNIAEILKEHGETELNAFLLDLGVSSFQLDNAGRGFSFHSDAPFSASALEYSTEMLDDGHAKNNRHPSDLEKNGLTNLCIDKVQMGLGCVNSWGAMPMEKYMLHYGDYEFTFIMQPVKHQLDMR